MIKHYANKSSLFILALLMLFFIASCKKDRSGSTAPVTATPTKLGLYEVSDSSIYKLLYIGISKVGTQVVSNDLVFDTGSGGMVLDAYHILPDSMITSSGFNFTGDSIVTKGITITNEQSIVEYGGDDNSLTKVYGNLAYAPVTIGDQNGNIVIKRLPFLLYYKGVDAKGNTLPHNYFDVMGVSSEYDITFSNNAYITSPFSYFDPGTGLTKGFKLAALGTSHFSYSGTLVPGVITLGLTADDLSASSGFIMNQLYFSKGAGYAPIFPATITYQGKPVSANVLFDTGTEPYSYIEDKAAKASISLLPQNSAVSVALTGTAFNYSYTTTATENLTYIENPATTGGLISIMSIEFFLNNEYMLDFTNNKLGLKNN